MLYFDTSFLVPLFLQEATSARIERFVRARSARRAQDLAISHWTRIEFSSLLGREVRMGGLDAAAARRADEAFETVAAETFVVFLPGVADFDLAKEFLARPATGLRAGDALHLAIARNRGAEAIYSLDKTMLKAGKTLGMKMSAGE